MLRHVLLQACSVPRSSHNPSTRYTTWAWMRYNAQETGRTVAYLLAADKYHRLTRPIFKG